MWREKLITHHVFLDSPDMPLPPLPDSDDEDYHLHMNIPADLDKYSSQLGLLGKIPHIVAEAEIIRDIFILEYPLTLDQLVYLVKERVKMLREFKAMMQHTVPLSAFARSLEDSVCWHVKQMQEVGIIW